MAATPSDEETKVPLKEASGAGANHGGQEDGARARNSSSLLDHLGGEAANVVPNASSLEVKRKLSQKNSGVLEEANLESLEDHFTLSILDPTNNHPGIWFVRCALFVVLYLVCGFYITFGANAFYWSVGLGALASYALCFACFFLESYVLVPRYYEDSVGLPMVHWLTWGVFIDIVYHILNPRNRIDCRAEEFAQMDAPVLVESLGGGGKEGDFWLDFCADVGDGFNPTFAVFSEMAKSVIRPNDVVLPRADAVLVGGDIAYPWPRYHDMMSRFIRPLSWAYPEDMADRPRNLYVMPGNHEWADGLRNMRRLVLNRATGKIGAWNVGNRTPYFAIKLPRGGWWMFCVDPGSEACQDLDVDQVAYFKRIVDRETKATDRFILCVHEPDWIKNSLHKFSLFRNLAFFRRDVLGERLRISLAGDLHYYRRMEEDDPGLLATLTLPSPYPHFVSHRRQLVVAGHGGAFSHPTYVPESKGGIRLGEPHIEGGDVYHVALQHPTPEQSRRTYNARWTRAFSFGKNSGFGSILAMMYMGMGLAVSPMDYSPGGGGAWPTGMHVLQNASYMLRMIKSFWFYPAVIFICIVFMVIATTSSALSTRSMRATAFAMGLAHIVVHVLFMLGMRKLSDAAWAQAIWRQDLEVDFSLTVLFCFLSNTTMYAVGYFLAPCWTGMYLFASQNLVANAYNEPMSSIEYQEDKGFVRMRFTGDGDVELFSVGIRATPRKWEEKTDSARTQEAPSHFESVDVKLESFLVERVLIKRDGVAANTSRSSSTASLAKLDALMGV